MNAETTNADDLAARLAVAEPSAGVWDGLDFEGLSAVGRIDALMACERLVRHAQGLLIRALGVLDCARARESDPERGCTESEISAALRWAPNSVQARLREAGALARLFPETLDALWRGRIGWVQARALVDLTAPLGDAAARRVQQRVLPLMERQSPAATRKALCRAVLAVDPEGARRRHEFARSRRRIELRPEPDGMATLTLYTAAETGVALLAAVEQHARIRAEGDPRTLDQRRADTLATLVLSGTGVRPHGTQYPDTASAPAALVHVVVGIDTLLGDNQQPGQLRGYGPISATQARALAFAPGSTWRRLLTAPDATLIHTDPHTYTPTAPVARLVRLRDQTCTFPTCAMPAQRCDLDHAQPFKHSNPTAGGPTTPANLHALCRHHTLKTAGHWKVSREATTDTTTWTAPTGHTYTTRPHPYPAAA